MNKSPEIITKSRKYKQGEITYVDIQSRCTENDHRKEEKGSQKRLTYKRNNITKFLRAKG